MKYVLDVIIKVGVAVILWGFIAVTYFVLDVTWHVLEAM